MLCRNLVCPPTESVDLFDEALMKSDGGRLTRILNAFSDFVANKNARKRLRFDLDSQATGSSDEALVRGRIRASALVLLAAQIAFAIRGVVLNAWPTPATAAIIVFLFAVVTWLYSAARLPMLTLRLMESAVFFGVSTQLGLQLHDQLQQLTAQDHSDPVEAAQLAVAFVAAVKDQIIATFGVMMIYGMFIPNTARRAALMVCVMAVIPGVVIAVNQSSLEAISSFRSQYVTAAGLFSGNLLALAVAAGCAIYGTAIMNRWRNRALEAEQLGQYRLGEKIGSGGMGDVYLAEHRLLKRTCAVKLIRSEMSEDATIVSRFEREVQATASLTHWNTVQVFDYGQTVEGTFFYVMEHLHGCNLRQVVQQTGPLSQDRTVFILKQVVEALREASAHGLVHRDIKPSNIFLAQAGARHDVVKLLDFGLVRPLANVNDGELSAGNELKGSPRYMCPEQAQGMSPDSRGDLYSLGATAYFLLSGRSPFDLDNALQLVIAHATATPASFEEIGVTVSPELERIVMKCLEKKPEDRYQTPDELLQALNATTVPSLWTWDRAADWWTENQAVIEAIHDADDKSCETAAEVSDTFLEETVIEDM